MSCALPTIMVSGALANKPFNGGAAWTRLSWALGLEQLGFQVCFVEQIDRQSCVDASGRLAPFEQSVNLAYFRQITEQFGLADASALIYDNGAEIYGLSYAELLEIADEAVLLVNISGHLRITPLLDRLRRKLYLDLDPGYTQFWHALGYRNLGLDRHDWYYTVGENIGTACCSIPTGEIPWRRTRQPVLLDHWPVAPSGRRNLFTTVASWRGPYGPVEYGGRIFGLKVHEFRRFVELPEHRFESFEIALEIDAADARDLAQLRCHGWQIAEPRRVVPDPFAFRDYVQTSGAEFSVAQGIYVETSSGWVGDRTVRYLASGKPALVQDTGLSANYPVGEGLVVFRTLDDAIVGAESIAVNYERHSRAARQIAETYFDAKVVLGQLIQEIGLAP